MGRGRGHTPLARTLRLKIVKEYNENFNFFMF